MISSSPVRRLSRSAPSFRPATSTTASSSTSFESQQQSTLSQEEVKKFSSKAFDYDFWWKSREGAPLRALNSLRIPLVRDELATSETWNTATPLSGQTILDIGCGGGLVTEPLARLGAKVTGIDPVDENLTTAKKHLEDCSPELTNQLTYICSTIEDYTKDHSGSFDGVIASEVLEHIDDVTLFLKSVNKALKKGGRFFITTINQTLASRVLAIFVAENILNLTPPGTHHYEKLVSLDGLIYLLHETGFQVDSIQGMCYNPFTGNWSWISSTQMNYAVVAVKV